MTASYAVGIDLGTTNSALAFTPLTGDVAELSLLLIPQLTSPGTVEALELLPSFLYHATPEDVNSGSLKLPWGQPEALAVGAWARRQAAEVPTRTVAAAKSWLCHAQVDRRAEILPWNAPADVPRISPQRAVQRYLEHLAEAWLQAFPDAPLRDQQVVLTVPASFDASARELTREAALAAGLPEQLVLLEEPLAAVYAWLSDQGEQWRKLLRVGDTLLVCDVGGGTTDFTSLRVTESAGVLELQREAVGDHILAGGDNMDLALAHLASQKFQAQGVELDPWQAVSLWHACRQAKEELLTLPAPAQVPVTVLGRGRKLIGGTLKTELDAGAVHTLLDGFFPVCALTAKPTKRRASGFREVGLPFASDPAITHHLAEFLTQHGLTERGTAPTEVLFNGGVFKSLPFKNRVLEVLSTWFPAHPPRQLTGNTDLDHAVARGAAAYAFAKERSGFRIRGGTARAYYLGLETSGPAIPGAARPLQALCVVPLGMEEGTQANVPGGEIGLVLGQPEKFRFFSSHIYKGDQPGSIRAAETDPGLSETAPLEMTLPAGDSGSDYVPVRLESRITELGMLELWCVETTGSRRWKFEFSVRDE